MWGTSFVIRTSAEHSMAINRHVTNFLHGYTDSCSPVLTSNVLTVVVLTVVVLTVVVLTVVVLTVVVLTLTT